MAYLDTAHLHGAARDGRSGWLAPLVAALQQWNDRRRARESLLSLSDHLLSDIGLSRADIDRMRF